jgi:phospholipase/carboxylesterase
MSEPTSFIHRFEAGSSAQSPTLLLLHGTGGNESDLIPLAKALDGNYGLLSPRGKVLEQGMPRFFRRLAEGVFDLEDLARRTEELARFLEEASGRYGFDKSKLVALGFSNGANIAASLLLTDPGALAGAILIRAMVPFVPAVLPDMTTKPILLLSGKRDPIVPPAQPEQLKELFRQAGAETTLHWEEAGHALTQNDVVIAGKWLQRHFPS